MVTITETWLQPGKRYNELMAWEYSIFKMGRGDGRIGIWTLVLVAKKHDANECH